MRKTSRKLIAGITLLALACRALIPLGFMPSGEGPFSIVICHEGFPAPLLHHDGPGHPGSGAHSEHCLFSSVTAAAPAPALSSLVSVLAGATLLRFVVPPSPEGVRLVHLPPSRAPPTLG